MAQVDGGYSSGNWGEPAAWGCSVFYPLISNGGWGNGAWGSDGWGLGNGGLVSASDEVLPTGTFNSVIREEAIILSDAHEATTLLDCQFNDFVLATETLSTQVTLGTSVIETVAANDVIVGERTFYGTSDETANASDTVSVLLSLPVAVTETVNADEIVVSALAIQALASETANASDIIVGVRNTFGAVEENALALAIELTNSNAIFAVGVNETSNATDTLTTNATFRIAVTETVTAQDVENRRLLWEPINTGTTEDWVLINTNQ